MFQNLARFCYRRRWLVLTVWVVLLVGLGALSGVAAGEFKTEFSLPGSESDNALQILREHGFDARAGETAQIVFQSESGFDDPVTRETIENFLTQIDEQVDGATVSSPFAPGGERQISQDGTIAYADINLSERAFEEYTDAGKQIQALGSNMSVEGLRIEYGGNMFWEQSQSLAELIGVIGAMIILLVAFGSLIAMGLPILTALFGIATGALLVMLGTNLIDMPNFTMGAVVMMGLGVGIDYALFIVTRYRDGLHDGLDAEAATVKALDTSGRAVLFAGITVIISILGILVMNLSAINGFAFAIAAGVLMTLLASLTLLPAMFGFIRERIDKFGLPHRSSASDDGSRQSVWYRWSRIVQGRPWVTLIAGLAFLAVLVIPAFDLRLGFGDAGNLSEDQTARQAFDLLAEGFGPGFNGPLMLVTETPNGEQDLAVLEQVTNELRQINGVANVSPPIASPEGGAAIIQVVPTTSPQDPATSDLVHHLRDDFLPVIQQDTGAGEILVSGSTAASIDFSDYTADRMPIFFALVLGLSFLLLMVVFRSVIVPIKAVIMNLISIGAAYGVIVAIFQWGWGMELFGIGREGPIEAWAPMMLFSVVFGLSMDYEVFLLSRIREEFDRTGDNGRAVADGLAKTARVISAAAAIMVLVFMGFALTPDRSLKLLGLGLAVAILIDATVVRLVLVPSAMELLGKLNWWMPNWLDRVLPRLNVEPEPEAPVRPQRPVSELPTGK